MMQQFMSSISQNNRPQQQSPPSDNQSMSTATPPHQNVSRASPASTALVMSSNNINNNNNSNNNQQQVSSRQLTPNTSSNSSNSQNGTGSSSNGNTGHHQDGPPNPMVRQFACHAKSMSAGVVVSVPGMSNNLGGINHQQLQQQQQQQHHHQQNSLMNQNIMQTSNRSYHHNHHHHHHNNNATTIIDPIIDATNLQQQQHNRAPIQQQVIKEHQRNHHHHHHHLSSTVSQQQQNHSTIAQQQQLHNTNSTTTLNPHHAINHINGSNSASTINNLSRNSQQQNQHQQAHGGSIIISNHNNIHNRSASTHLSSILLNQNHHINNNSNNNIGSNHHLTASSRNNYPHSHAVTNSIWSIDENISKSHGKLSSSNYLPDPYLFSHSITDMSCDNISNVSQLIDGQPNGPAPAYYQIHPPHNHNNPHTHSHHHHQQQQSSSSTMRLSRKVPEFLPICDLMFNLISMIIYFCENTFGIIALFALYYHTNIYHWALLGGTFVLISNLVSQYVSYRWLFLFKLDEFRRKQEAEEELEQEEAACDRNRSLSGYHRSNSNLNSNNNNKTNSNNNINNNNNNNDNNGNNGTTKNKSSNDDYQCGSCNWLPDRASELLHFKFMLSMGLDLLLHIFCLGFLVRYIKLVIPVNDTARVKREARDLCLLRMLHGFIQSAPLLLLFAYLVHSQPLNSPPIINIIITSAILSLINVCWALASFTKYAREKYMHKFVLTWLGIVSQLLWRLGTVSSRVVALTIYAVYYNYWMLVVLALHWITMFFWLIKPGNLLRDEVNLSPTKKVSYAAAVAWIHCFCFVNFEEHNSKLKTTTFYLIMFLENNLLLTVCLIFSPQVNLFKYLSIMVVYLGFVIGMLFMFLYYKYFHVNVLDNGLSCSQESIDSIADQLSPAGKKIAGFKPGTLRLKSEDGLSIRGPVGHRYRSNINHHHATLSHGGGSHIGI